MISYETKIQKCIYTINDELALKYKNLFNEKSFFFFCL